MLFEYRITPDSRKRRTCEETIVVFEAAEPVEAFAKANTLGKNREFKYENAEGGKVHVRFLGLVDLLPLDVCEDDEVWYRTFTTSKPEARIRSKQELSAFRALPSSIGANARYAPKG